MTQQQHADTVLDCVRELNVAIAAAVRAGMFVKLEVGPMQDPDNEVRMYRGVTCLVAIPLVVDSRPVQPGEGGASD